MCGRKTAEVTNDGVCPICYQRELAQGHRDFQRRLYAEVNGIKQTEEYKRAKREHAAARQETSRLCRKYGLPGKRGKARKRDED